MNSHGAWNISRLRLKNFRNYAELDIDFSEDATLLIGENGAGKTAILDALAIMLTVPINEFGATGVNIHASDAHAVPRSADGQLAIPSNEPYYPVEIEVEGTINGEPWTWSRSKRSFHGRTTTGEKGFRSFLADIKTTAQDSESLPISLPVLAAYGVERLTKEVRNQGRIQQSRFGAYDNSLDPRSDLKRLLIYIEALSKFVFAASSDGAPVPRAAEKQLKAIKYACDRVLEITEWHNLRWNPLLDTATLDHPQHGTLPLSMLATGTRIAAGLTIDIASRMSRANPHLSDHDVLLCTPGIVLIDEVDMHLHPRWQKEIVPALRRVFPRVQFILTSHSPQVISTLPASRIRILRNNEVVTPRFAEGLMPRVILDILQDTDPAPNTENRKQLNRYLELVRAGEGTSEQALELRRKLDDEMGGKELNEELIEADAIIDVESW